MFIFDTSGSMAENGNGTAVGEGPNVCTTTQNPNYATSRIYNLKQALRSALQQVGTDEANFGLMSFPLVQGTAYVNTCATNAVAQPFGHYQASPAQTVTTPFRVMGGEVNHSATGFGNGCLMSSNLNNETTYGTWFDTGAAQVLRVGVTTAGPGVTPTTANYDPADGNIPAIYKWIDNIELPTATGAVTDPELHALGYTPLGRSFFYSRVYFDGVVKPHDPRASCRQNVVIMLTDGADTCDDVTPPDNTFNVTNCSGGGNYDQFNPVAQACQLFKTSGIKTYLVTDTGLSTAQLATADRIANAGGTTAAIRVSLADANAAKAAIVGIIASTVPPSEVCNGKDDNCNGIIDEGVSNMCAYSTTDPNTPDNLLGTAAAHCAVEVANCKDDNCNGMIDEGFPLNACGQGAGCPIPPEICDGIDNNCNGDVDEGFDVGGACDNGLTGSCRRIGIKECSPDHTTVTCNLGDAPISPEICNGVDDDCNGQIDDGPLPGVGVDCGIQGQGCTKGTTICMGGKIVCTATSNPQTEICNGLDDDCNGVIDDGMFPGVGDSCLCPGLTAAQVGQGMCRAGRLVCKGAMGVVCDGCVLPSPEICDGKDNDCDGVGDNTAMCPTGFSCRDGACALLCRPGEFPCAPGYDCTENYCVPNRCKNVTCPSDQKCDLATGSCVDLCFKVSCLPGQTCSGGRCLDCSNSPDLACQPGQACVGRTCVTDKCYGVTCDTAVDYCANGACVPITCSPACGAGQQCFAGQCQSAICSSVTCGAGTYCDPPTGDCLPSLCAGKTCPYCAPATGECTTDPCGNVQCPFCYSCKVDPSGQPSCLPQSDACNALKVQAGNAGGGCSCSVDDSHGTASLASLFVLGAFGLMVGRRRRRW
jgi:MYXO-CTERM domain-containing protein